MTDANNITMPNTKTVNLLNINKLCSKDKI